MKAVALLFSFSLISAGLLAYMAPPYTQMRPGAYSNTQLPNYTEEDKAITREIQGSINDDYYLAPYSPNIEIYTLDGYVTLTGRLNSDTVRLRMGDKAKMARGVKLVNNNIEVEKTK